MRPIAEMGCATATAGNDLKHVVDGLFEIVVDHDKIGKRHANGFFIFGLAQALSYLLVGVSATTQPALLLGP